MGIFSPKKKIKSIKDILILQFKRLIFILTIGVICYLLFAISNTILRPWFLDWGIIEDIELNGHVDDTLLIESSQGYNVAIRQIEGTIKDQLQTRYNLGFTRIISSGIVTITYQALVNYAIDINKLKIETHIDTEYIVTVPLPYVQCIDLDYGSVKTKIDGGYLVSSEEGKSHRYLRNLSRLAKKNAESEGSVFEIRMIAKEQIKQLIKQLYKIENVKVFFEDEIYFKAKKEEKL